MFVITNRKQCQKLKLKKKHALILLFLYKIHNIKEDQYEYMTGGHSQYRSASKLSVRETGYVN